MEFLFSLVLTKTCSVVYWTFETVNAVFLDTVGLLAVWDASDQWHVAANAAYQRLLTQGRPLVVTDFVLLECGNAASRRPYRSRVTVPTVPNSPDPKIGFSAEIR